MDIRPFLEKNKLLAIVGASNKEQGFGLKVYRDLKRAGFKVVPVNPNYDKIQDDKCYDTLSGLPKKPEGIILITPPEQSEKIVQEAKKLKIKNIWFQPGSENEKAIYKAEGNVVKGRCIMVERRINKHDPFGEIIEHLEEYDKGTPPKSSKDAVCD